MVKLSRPNRLKPQFYDAHETHRMRELEGARLASFRARGIAFIIDASTVFLLFIIIFFLSTGFRAGKFAFTFGTPLPEAGDSPIFHVTDTKGAWWLKYAEEFGIPILYWGLITYVTNGHTPGKWIAGIRVASTSHARIGFWQSVERALGYSVSALEAGLGFISYFTTKNRRTSHDRLAETIVIVDNDRRLLNRIRRLQKVTQPLQ